MDKLFNFNYKKGGLKLIRNSLGNQ
jgi:hypothetical protein